MNSPARKQQDNLAALHDFPHDDLWKEFHFEGTFEPLSQRDSITSESDHILFALLWLDLSQVELQLLPLEQNQSVFRCEWVEFSGQETVKNPFARTHLEDVAIAPATLTRPGWNGSEDPTWKKLHFSGNVVHSPVRNWSRRGFSTSLVFCLSAYFLVVFLLILRFNTAWVENISISRLQNFGNVSHNDFFSADLERMIVVFRKWSQLGRSFDHHFSKSI